MRPKGTHGCICSYNSQTSMCRNIKNLHNFEPPATDQEIHDAALQFVRKVSGSTKTSVINEVVFSNAVKEITTSTHKLLQTLKTTSSPRNREVEAERQQIKNAKRFKNNI